MDSKSSNIYCFTSITFSYLSRARLLVKSLKKHHPDWLFVLVITDKEPDGFCFDAVSDQFDEVIWGQDLPIENIDGWLFKHQLVEVCTAVKGIVLDMLANRPDADKVFYLDPDTVVVNSLSSLVSELNENEILLTPHQLDPDNSWNAIRDNEIGSMKHGIYNLGFIAISARGEGLRFSKWWESRLLDFCYDDIPGGLLTDQRWCDHVPVFFENVKIIKDPGCNVASWNLSQRQLKVGPDGELLVNGELLKFYHVTKFDTLGRVMTERYAEDNTEVYELWQWYGRQLASLKQSGIPRGWWYYADYEDGEKIQNDHRLLYRARKDLQAAFPNPYLSGVGTFQAWLLHNQV